MGDLKLRNKLEEIIKLVVLLIVQYVIRGVLFYLSLKIIDYQYFQGLKSVEAMSAAPKAPVNWGCSGTLIVLCISFSRARSNP